MLKKIKNLFFSLPSINKRKVYNAWFNKIYSSEIFNAQNNESYIYFLAWRTTFCYVLLINILYIISYSIKLPIPFLPVGISFNNIKTGIVTSLCYSANLFFVTWLFIIPYYKILIRINVKPDYNFLAQIPVYKEYLNGEASLKEVSKTTSYVGFMLTLCLLFFPQGLNIFLRVWFKAEYHHYPFMFSMVLMLYFYPAIIPMLIRASFAKKQLKYMKGK